MTGRRGDHAQAAGGLRWLCIHGHFYQPPRENAWLEEIEIQDSAYPYHDWNRRITAECYAPNARARILDSEQRITGIVNNYERISFNFGPTLLEWLERRAPESYRAILEADRASAVRFAGHGSAMAQAYNHPILPLCNERDKRTQLVWGLRDFETRFGRPAEGLWLPETAVDTPTLELLAELGIRFTILAPRQARAIRRIGDDDWLELSESGIDPRRPYRAELTGGRSLALFFYDGQISQGVAFDQLLARGDRFLSRLLDGFDETSADPQLVHVATDGETYGHHHRFGDMALAWTLDRVEREGTARLTNYAEFLDRFPPRYEARIVENSSWSCAHGVGRWKEDCGCHGGGHPEWHQRWRAPLRSALNRLRDRLAAHFEREGGSLLHDPWAARDDYIDVVLDRGPERLATFLDRHARPGATDAELTRARKLLEMQRHGMLMFTSCGWFFDELSGIETVQILQYAARAAELAEQTGAGPVEGDLLDDLIAAPSNLPRIGDGAELYRRRIGPSRFDLGRVGANVAAGWLYETGDAPVGERAHLFRELERDASDAGDARLLQGRLEVESARTGERRDLVYGFLNLGDHNFSGGFGDFVDEESYRRQVAATLESFRQADLPQTRQRLERHLGPLRVSLQTLARDLQRRILERLVSHSAADAERELETLYRRHAALMQFLHALESPLPRALWATATVVLNGRLRSALTDESIDVAALRRILDDVGRAGVELDGDGLAYAAREALEKRIEALATQPVTPERLLQVLELARTVKALPFAVDLARAEERFFELSRGPLREALDERETAEPLRALAVAMRVAL